MASATNDGRSGGVTPYFIYALLTATVGPLLFGYHLAELNAPQDAYTCRIRTKPVSFIGLPQCIQMDQSQIGLVNSVLTLGGLIGALGAGTVASKYGRLAAMRLNCAFFILGPVAEAFAPSVAVLACGRFVSGIGAGAAVVVAPIFVSEISPPSKKGFFGAFTQVMINVGILVAQSLGLFLSRSQLWRVILGVGGIIGLAQFISLLPAIESPKWSAEQGRPKAAKRELQRLRGSNYDIKDEVKGWHLEDPEQRAEEEEEGLLNDNEGAAAQVNTSHNHDRVANALRNSSIGIFEVITHPKAKRATYTVMVIMVSQQLCGVNSIVFYGVSVLSDLLTTSSALLNVFVALSNLIVTVACAPLVDRLGRKPCLMASTMGMGVSSALLGVAILAHIPVLSIVAVFAFIGSFALGLGPIPFLISSELVGAEAVGATQSWALAANWLATFVVAQFFPIVDKALGKGKVFFVFAVIAVLFTVFTAFFIPETKGKMDADDVWGVVKNRERSHDGE